MFEEKDGNKVNFERKYSKGDRMSFEGQFEALAPQITGNWEIKKEGHGLSGEFFVWKGIDNLPPTVENNLKEYGWYWE